jgi:hypothetical protein
MPNSGTMAIWCVPRVGSQPTEIEAHFNYWRIAGDRNFVRKSAGPVEDVVEIGVLVSDVHQINEICIYMPTIIKRAKVVDCASYLAKGEFAQGIFNEVLAITAPAAGGPQCIILHNEANAVFARVHRFANGTTGIDQSELGIAEQHGGTTLTISKTAIQEACRHATPLAPTYFRLRIHLKEGAQNNPFVKVIQPHDRLFQSGFDEIEYIDFRMNEARTLPTMIEQTMRADRIKGGAVSFKLVAFLTAVPVHSELSVSNTPSHKMRLLEPSWNTYLASGIPEGMVVYHWKRLPEATKPIADFSAFVKLQTRRSSRKILAKYLGIAFAFGLAGNLAASAMLWGSDKIFAPAPAVSHPADVNIKPTTAPSLRTGLPPLPVGAASSTSINAIGNGQ